MQIINVLPLFMTNIHVHTKLLKRKKHKTLDDAIMSAKIMNSQGKSLYKLIAYKCSTCQCYHIGNSNKPITEKEVEKYKNELDMMWKFNIGKLRNK